MKKLKLYIFFIPVVFFHLTIAAQNKSRLYITIIAADTRQLTPAMVCITNVKTSEVLVPPFGNLAGPPTYPDIFYTGIDFKQDKNWIGPIRKMSGLGAVNGQRTYVYGASPTLPYWPEPVIYQTSGAFSIDLAAGTYRVSIAHGNEYLPISEEITISASQKKIKKSFFLNRWINLPKMGWYSGDVHAHHPLYKKKYKDYMMQLAQAEDVHLVNMLQMGDRSQTYFQPEGFGQQFRITNNERCLVSGQEDPRSTYGHIIALNTLALERDTSTYNYYDLVLNKIHRNPQSLAGYAHFAYGGEGVKEGMAIFAPGGGIDFVELLQNTKLNASDYHDYLNLGFRLTAAAGSDFPWGSTIGDGRTFVFTGNPFSADKWFAGMKAGQTFVSNGPALFLEAGGQIMGAEIIREKGAGITVTAKAFSHPSIGVIEKMQLFNNDGLLFETGNTGRLDSVVIKFDHKLLKSQWVTAVVYCANGAVAHSSPLYFVIDQQPWFDAVKGSQTIRQLLIILEKAKAVETGKLIPDEGMIERIKKAANYYRVLQKKMEETAKIPG